MAEFEEVMQQQLETSLHSELENLLSTADGAEAEVRRRQERAAPLHGRRPMEWHFQPSSAYVLFFLPRIKKTLCVERIAKS